jgi:arylsulfatase
LLASAVDLVPTMLACAGLDDATVATLFPGLHGHSLLPAATGVSVRDGRLTAVETITTLDADFWTQFSDPEAPQRLMSGDLRPDWSKRGFLRGFTDARYSFGRSFSPLEPNRPTDVDSLFEKNDVVLYDREHDPDELVNLAADPAHRDLVAECSARLEALITAEVGEDRRVWVLERPNLLGWPTWRGDQAA